MNVNDVMVTEVACCSPQTSLQDIALLMWNNDCGAIPLIDAEEHPVGIVTDRDIAMGAALQHRPLWEMTGTDIAGQKELYCCGPDNSIQSALRMMERHQVRRLPVVNDYNQLCGMVSLGDIISVTGTERTTKASGDSRISSRETLEFLRQISAHHHSHKSASPFSV